MMKRLLSKLTGPKARSIALLWLIVGGVTGFTIYQSVQDNACTKEFRAALIARADANERADELGKMQDQAQLQWLKDVSNPPATLGDAFGPNRIKWLKLVNDNGIARVQQLIDARAAALAQRQSHPLPEITCGK
jgi:hypothetical protein